MDKDLKEDECCSFKEIAEMEELILNLHSILDPILQKESVDLKEIQPGSVLVYRLRELKQKLEILYSRIYI
jgi:hypothetical protein